MSYKCNPSAPYPHPNPEVMEVQNMLNTIRQRFRTSWEYLNPDGIYGPRTTQVVKSFQIYRNITPATGVLGPTTINYIRDYYCTPVKVAAPNSLEDNDFGFFDLLKKVGDFFDHVIKFVEGEIDYVKNFGKASPNKIFDRYISFTTGLTPQVTKLKRYFVSISEQNKIIAQNADWAKKQIYQVRSFFEKSKIQNSHRATSKAQKMIRIYGSSARDMQNQLVAELKRMDIIGKIKSFFRSKGIKIGDINIKALQGKINVNLKLGSVFKVISAKDVLWDLCHVTQWGEKEWNKRFYKHLTEFLDDIVIGLVSAVLAELLVGVVVVAGGAVGITISAGWLVALVALVAVLIGALIGWFLDTSGVSFSELAIDGYRQIADYVFVNLQ